MGNELIVFVFKATFEYGSEFIGTSQGWRLGFRSVTQAALHPAVSSV